MITKEQKKALVQELREKLQNSKSAVVCDYKGVKVSEMAELRSGLQDLESTLKVSRKTLLQRALKEEGIKLDVRSLKGQVAVAYGSDEVAPAKALHDFAKKNKRIQILAGILEGQVLSQEEVLNLAKLPSKEELLAKLVGSLNSPLSGLVGVLNGNMRGLVQVLNGIKESKEV